MNVCIHVSRYSDLHFIFSYIGGFEEQHKSLVQVSSMILILVVVLVMAVMVMLGMVMFAMVMMTVMVFVIILMAKSNKDKYVDSFAAADHGFGMKILIIMHCVAGVLSTHDHTYPGFFCTKTSYIVYRNRI